jgi:hypothetical protein
MLYYILPEMKGKAVRGMSSLVKVKGKGKEIWAVGNSKSES